jgi:hypothetical protein
LPNNVAGPIKLGENLGLCGFWDAHTGISHAYDHACPALFYRERHIAAFRGVFYGIAEQIDQNLLGYQIVGLDDDWLFGCDDMKVNVPGLDRQVEFATDFFC